MSTEKLAAFNEAWAAMALEAFLANQKMTLSLAQSFWFPWAYPRPTFRSASRQLNDAALGILGKGMVPIRRRAAANAKRLRRAR